MVLKSEGCESRANIGNIARVSQMSHECRKLRGASDELGSDMGDCLQLILTQYEPNGNCVPTTVSIDKTEVAVPKTPLFWDFTIDSIEASCMAPMRADVAGDAEAIIE